MTHFQREAEGDLTTDFETTEHTEHTEWSNHNTLVLNQRIVTKIYQQPDPKTGRMKVVVQLSTMLVGKFGDRFDFHDHFAKAEQVRLINLPKRPALIFQCESWLTLERNLSIT